MPFNDIPTVESALPPDNTCFRGQPCFPEASIQLPTQSRHPTLGKPSLIPAPRDGGQLAKVSVLSHCDSLLTQLIQLYVVSGDLWPGNTDLLENFQEIIKHACSNFVCYF